jgi:hypothetical protein
MENYLVTEATNIDSESICNYIDRTWKRKIALSIVDFFDWQFKYYPGGNGINRSLVVIDKKTSDIYGFMGLNPRRFILNGNVLNGAELTTWEISEEMRGKSIGTQMQKYLVNNYEVLFGMGITEAALNVYKKMGYKYIRSIPRFYKIFNLERTKAISKITTLGEKLQKRIKIKIESKHDVEEFNNTSTYRNNYKNLNCFSRSLSDIEWRYINHPFFKYKIYIVNPNSEKEVFVILRVEEHEAICVCHIVDYYGYEGGFLDALNFIDYHCINNNVDFADFYCFSSNITRHFWYNGWFSLLNDLEVTIPHLFNPIELKNPPTTSLIMYSSNHLIQLCDINRLYITKGDCDLDRPTIFYLQQNNLI